MTPIISRGRTLRSIGPSSASCLLTKWPPYRELHRCHFKSQDKYLGGLPPLHWCFARMINIELWTSISVEVHVCSRAAVRLESKCWTVFMFWANYCLQWAWKSTDEEQEVTRFNVQSWSYLPLHQSYKEAESSALWKNGSDLCVFGTGIIKAEKIVLKIHLVLWNTQ